MEHHVEAVKRSNKHQNHPKLDLRSSRTGDDGAAPNPKAAEFRADRRTPVGPHCKHGLATGGLGERPAKAARRDTSRRRRRRGPETPESPKGGGVPAGLAAGSGDDAARTSRTCLASHHHRHDRAADVPGIERSQQDLPASRIRVGRSRPSRRRYVHPYPCRSADDRIDHGWGHCRRNRHHGSADLAITHPQNKQGFPCGTVLDR